MNDELGQAYAQALLAIARSDREINPEEANRVRELVRVRSASAVAVDFEASFFGKLTPEALAEAATKANANGREVGKWLVADAMALAAADHDVKSREAQTILRFARALGCTDEDIGAVTQELNEWL